MPDLFGDSKTMTAQQVGRALRMNAHDVRRLGDCGRIPRPIEIEPGRPLWRADEIRAFIAALECVRLDRMRQDGMVALLDRALSARD